MAILAALFLGGCFDPPVEETLHLEFDPDLGPSIELSVRISGGDERNERLAERVERVRRALAGGWDDWSRRFERISPRLERVFWERQEGLLTHYERAATLEDSADLTRFFADTGLHVGYAVADGDAELTIYPGDPARATRRQRRQVEQALDSWVAAVDGYLGAGAELYAYLELRPDRAVAVFADLFGDLAASSTPPEVGPLADPERELVERLEDAMEGVWGVLQVAHGEEHSLNELSKLVYDPFPCRLTVRPAAPPREVEGFRGDDLLSAGGTGLWEALESLEGRWIAPDPLLLLVRHERTGRELDVVELARRPRRVEPTAAGELAAAIEEALAPAPVYRAVWRIPSP